MAPHLPTPLIARICRTLSDSGDGAPTLASLRLANRRLGVISTPIAFRSVRVTCGHDVRSILAAFSRDGGLAAGVRRVDIDLCGSAAIIPALGLAALAKLVHLAASLEHLSLRLVGWGEGMPEPALVLCALAASARPTLRALELVVEVEDAETALPDVTSELLRRVLIATPALDLLHLSGIAVRGSVDDATAMPSCRPRSVFILRSALCGVASALVGHIIGRATRISTLGSAWPSQQMIAFLVNRWSRPLEIEVGGSDAMPVLDQHAALDWIEVAFRFMPLAALRTHRMDATRAPALLLYDPFRVVSLHLHGADPAFSAVELGQHLLHYSEVTHLREIVASRDGDVAPLQIICEILGIKLHLRDVGYVAGAWTS